jgi:TM2 domain-containing membrane protein YozV
MTAPTPNDQMLRYLQAESEFAAHKMEFAPAFLLCFFLGTFGAHRFYLRRTGTAVAMLVVTLVSFPLMFVLIGFASYAAIGIWAFVDLFLVSGIVREENAIRRAHVFARYGIGPAPMAPPLMPGAYGQPIQPSYPPPGDYPALPPGSSAN